MSDPSTADGWDPVQLEGLLGPVDERANAEVTRASLLRAAERALWATDQDGEAHRAIVAYIARLKRARGPESITEADRELGPVMAELATWRAPELDPNELGDDSPEPLSPEQAERPLGPLELRSLRQMAANFGLAAVALGEDTAFGRGLARFAIEARGVTCSGDAVSAIRWIEVATEPEAGG